MNVSGTYTKPTLDKLLILVGGFYKALLDSQGRFSVTQLDNVVKAFYEGDSATVSLLLSLSLFVCEKGNKGTELFARPVSVLKLKSFWPSFKTTASRGS